MCAGDGRGWQNIAMTTTQMDERREPSLRNCDYEKNVGYKFTFFLPVHAPPLWCKTRIPIEQPHELEISRTAILQLLLLLVAGHTPRSPTGGEFEPSPRAVTRSDTRTDDVAGSKLPPSAPFRAESKLELMSHVLDSDVA